MAKNIYLLNRDLHRRSGGGGNGGAPLEFAANASNSAMNVTNRAVGLTVPTDANLLIAVIQWRWWDISSVVWNGSENLTYLPNSHLQHPSSDEQMKVYYIINPTPGTHSVVATLSNAGDLCVGVTVWKNATGSPFGTLKKTISNASLVSDTASGGTYYLDVLTRHLDDGVFNNLGIYMDAGQTQAWYKQWGGAGTARDSCLGGSYKIDTGGVTMGWHWAEAGNVNFTYEIIPLK